MTTTEITPERTCTNPACDWRGAAADCRHIGADAASVRTLAFDLCPKCATPKQSWRAVPLLPVLFFDADGNGPNVVNLWIEEVREHRDGERLIAPRSIGLRFELADSFPVPQIMRPGGFHLRDEDAVTLRDAITAAIDAPRLAALTTAAADRTARGVHLYTAPQPFDFASALDQVYLDVSDDHDEYGHIADEFTAAMEANRDAIEARLTAAWDAIVVEFGLHVELADAADPPDIEIAPHPAPVDPREAEASTLWLTQPVRCVGNVEPPCGWSGVGADITDHEDNGETPCCPKCEEGVVENILAPPPPRYVVGAVGSAPDGTLVAVLLGDGVGLVDACREFNRDQSAASEVTWHRPADGFCSDLPMDTRCIIDTAASQSGEG